MAPPGLARPRVSRETRLLFATVLLSIAALWVLARLRFPERPVTPNPVPPVLTQLAPTSVFEDLAALVAEAGPRVAPSLVVITAAHRGDHGVATSGFVAALRYQDGLAVGLIPGRAIPAGARLSPEASIVARDPATGLAVIRVPAAAAPPLSTWAPRRPASPRHLLAADVASEGATLRPVFVASLVGMDSPIWGESIWVVPPRTDLVPGSFAFTTEGALAGLVVQRGQRVGILPGDALLEAAERVLEDAEKTAGYLGLEVQPLTTALATATGADEGLVVTWVDPEGPAAGLVRAIDIIDAIDGRAVPTLEHWQARVLRLGVGESVTVRVRRSGEARDAQMTTVAGPAVPRASERPLGLTMRPLRRLGAEVLRVDPGSAADAAGFEAGDVITLVGDLEAPTPAQVSRAFAEAAGHSVAAAVTRGDTHLIVTLEKR
jgi:S1-C subfamily serine protease